MQKYSTLMKLFRFLKMDSIAWSLRRIHCPVDRNALVLEVGSGGNPYARANILLDAYFETQERNWVPLITDRPFVFGNIESLPFKDKAFDFIIASHVLEHSLDPIKAIAEFQRVAKAGYIEVPDAFFERINPYLDHRLEITDVNDELIIRKKSSYMPDPDTVDIFMSKAHVVFGKEIYRKYPFYFHVRYYWNDKITFKILNPDVKIDWKAKFNNDYSALEFNFKAKVKQGLLKLFRTILSQNTRNKNINIKELLQCTNCKSNELKEVSNKLVCSKCSIEYTKLHGFYNFTEK